MPPLPAPDDGSGTKSGPGSAPSPQARPPTPHACDPTHQSHLFLVNWILLTIPANPGFSTTNRPGRSRPEFFKRPIDRAQNFLIAILTAFEIFSSRSSIAIEIRRNLHRKPRQGRREQPAGISSATVVNFSQSRTSSRLKFFHRPLIKKISATLAVKKSSGS